MDVQAFDFFTNHALGTARGLIRVTAVSLFLLTGTTAWAAPQAGRSAEFESAKAAFDVGQWDLAASSFQTIIVQRASGVNNADEKAEAAVFTLRSLVNAQDVTAFNASREACLAAVAGTPFEGQALLEVGKHLAKNVKDAPAAVAKFNAILASFPTDQFAASGALYERGLLESDVLRTPYAAKESLTAL